MLRSYRKSCSGLDNGQCLIAFALQRHGVSIARVAPDLPRILERFPRPLRRRIDAYVRRATLTGSSSAGQYSVMARELIQSLYCSDMGSLLKRLNPVLEETSRFPNIELLETDDDFVYLDARDDLAASPVQTYLELMQGDKREQETAGQLRTAILQPLKKKG